VQARPAGIKASDRIAEPWGQRAPYGPGDAWPVRIDTFLGRVSKVGVSGEMLPRWDEET
jgi:hypothetical protein